MFLALVILLIVLIAYAVTFFIVFSIVEKTQLRGRSFLLSKDGLYPCAFLHFQNLKAIGYLLLQRTACHVQS